MSGKHFDYIPIDWVSSPNWNHTRSVGSDTARWHEHHHELSERVLKRQEDEDMGMGALFDLQYGYETELGHRDPEDDPVHLEWSHASRRWTW